MYNCDAENSMRKRDEDVPYVGMAIACRVALLSFEGAAQEANHQRVYQAQVPMLYVVN
jgi:hypothetical protein